MVTGGRNPNAIPSQSPNVIGNQQRHYTMKRLFLLSVLITLTNVLVGQTKICIDKPFVGLPTRMTKVTEVDSLSQLPTRIPFIINNLFKTAMTDFVSNIVFIKGQVIDIESWAAKDSTFQTEYKFVIPKYELYFELRDTSIGIKSYCFEVSLDQYGQITRFEWPREEFNKRASFIKPDLLQKTALTYATKKKYKTQTYISDLYFDEGRQRLHWHFSFLQKSTGDNFDYSKEYKTIVLDALDNYVIEELEMRSTGISD